MWWSLMVLSFQQGYGQGNGSGSYGGYGQSGGGMWFKWFDECVFMMTGV